MHRLLRRPSPALVVSGLALLFALGGTSIAAVSALPANSVGPVQLKANAVTNPKIRNGAVNNPKIANNAVTSSKVLNGSLTSADFAEGQIPAGPQGPAGPAGPSGISGYQVVEADSVSDATATKQLTANCPSGKRVLGGGLQILGAGKQYIASNGGYPSANGTAFTGEGQNIGTSIPVIWQLKVYAICATVAS
jgi:hypothetical protein